MKKRTLADKINVVILKIIAILYLIGWFVSSVMASSEASKALSSIG